MKGTDDRFGRLQDVLSLAGDDLESMERLCIGSVRHLSMSGAGVSVVTDSGDRAVVLTTDAVSKEIEELQVSLGEGPCVDAWSVRLPVFEPDLSGSPRRWPGFGPAATAAGAAAVFALPLQVGAARLGALDVYRDAPGELSGPDLHDALRLSDAVTQVLLRIQAVDPTTADKPADGGPEFGAEVHQAVGMAMVQLDVELSEALARLRAQAYSEGRSLRELARDVVARRLRLERDT